MKKQSRKGVLSSDFSVILFLFSTKGLWESDVTIARYAIQLVRCMSQRSSMAFKLIHFLILLCAALMF